MDDNKYMNTYPTSPAQFRKQAEAGFRKANPDAADATFDWTFGPKRVTFPTGITGFSGVANVSATGFKTKVCVASATRETGLSVR